MTQANLAFAKFKANATIETAPTVMIMAKATIANLCPNYFLSHAKKMQPTSSTAPDGMFMGKLSLELYPKVPFERMAPKLVNTPLEMLVAMANRIKAVC